MNLYLRILAIHACLVFIPAGLAADSAKSVPPKAVLAPPDTKAAWERRIPALDVDALPLGEVIMQLRKEFPELNFLIRPVSASDHDLNGVTIRLQIRNVTLAEIIKALELAADQPIQITASPEDRLVVVDFKHKPADQFAQMPIATRAYSLAAYLSGLGDKEAEEAMQQLYQAIELAGQLTREGSGGERRFSAKLQMHRGTKLLIAVGRVDDLQIIDQIADQLRIAGNSRPPRAGNEMRAADPSSAKPPAALPR